MQHATKKATIRDPVDLWFTFLKKRQTNHPAQSLSAPKPPALSLFFFNDTATIEIYTLSLHDALPILFFTSANLESIILSYSAPSGMRQSFSRSEEHTSELQSPYDIVCRLLLDKK